MNKSKFLKRSLAAILAILMVVAMVPLSALAAETYDISVNSRKATPSDDGTSYAVTIYNTRLASIDWAPAKDCKAEITTKRNVKLPLPVSNLDLMTEATANGSVYTLDLTVTNTKTNEKTEAKLNITVETSVPNDDVTLQAVRVNQTVNGVTYSAISGTKPENGKIKVTIPLGMDYADVNFNSDLTDASQIFVPSSPYAKVSYKAPASVGEDGTVTVEAPTGRKASYKVEFVQEAGLTDMSVKFGTEHATGPYNFTGPTFEAGQNYAVYTAYVPNLSDATKVDITKAHILFSHGKNVVRVEDPNADAGNATLAAWADSTAATVDEPIQSEQNTIAFVTGSGADASSKVAYLTAKTKANQKDADGSDVHAYYGNVKLVLKDAAVAPTEDEAPKITEFQFNGYESQYNPDGLSETIEVYVDASYYTNVAAGKLTGRVSLTTDDPARVWITGQNNNNKTAAATRVGKPGSVSYTLSDIDTKDRQFSLRVANATNPSIYRDYKVVLKSSGNSKEIRRVYLADAKKNVVLEATKAGDNQFVFNADDYKATVAKPGTWTNTPASTTEFAVSYEYDTNGDGTFDEMTLDVKYTFSDKFFGSEGISSVLPGDVATYIFHLDWNNSDQVLELKASSDDGNNWEVIAASEVDSTKLNQLNFVTESGKDIGSLTFTFAGGTGGAGGLNCTDVNAVTDYYFSASGGGNGSFFTNTYMSDVDAKTHGCFGAAYTDHTVRVSQGNNPTKYTATGFTTSLKDTLKGYFLVVESDQGVVVTPGGDMSDTLTGGAAKKTDVIGASPWQPQSGTTYTATPSLYQEHENYIVTLGDYWDATAGGAVASPAKYDYLLKLSNNYKDGDLISVGDDTAGDGTHDVALIMTTNNKGASNTDNKKTWAIRFQDSDVDPIDPTYSEAAELKIKGVTTAVDEDLIYDGRTQSASKDTDFASGTTGNDAPYIGAIAARGDDHNYFKVDEPVAVPNTLNEYSIKVHVPEDYFKANQVVYLDALTISAKAGVKRGSAATAKGELKTPDPTDWYENYIVEAYSLDMDSQDKATNGVPDRQFTIGSTDLNAWYGGNLNTGAVSANNTLYVYNEKKIETNDVTATSYTRKYYITFVKEEFDTIDTLSGVTPADSSTGITGTPNAYEKWLNLSVPFGKNWTNYRDDSSRDFKLNFTKGGKAILVDAAQDAHNTPFGSAGSSTTYLDKDRQELREAQIDEDTVFFVKENELWIYDQYTGKETKVTGRGLNTKFTYSGWGVITSGNAELHVFNEDQRSINTYRLTLNVNEASSAKEIVSIRVDETSAVNTSGTLWTVDLGPAGSENLAKVMLNITVSATAQVVSVGGKEYVANGTYDLTKPVTIIVKDENGDTKSFTLSATGDDPNPPVEEKESDKYTDIPSGVMGDWVKDAINYGIMSSNVSGKYEFQPKDTTPRRYFALMVARADIMANNGAITTKEAADEKLLADYGNKEPDFKDTAKEDPKIKAAIVYCQEKKIMNGDEKGNFNPGDIVDRMQVASMLANWLKLTPGDKTENTHGFKDWDKIASWAKGNINAVATDKIMEGNDDGTFGTGKLTREQTAVVMVKVYKRLKGITD